MEEQENRKVPHPIILAAQSYNKNNDIVRRFLSIDKNLMRERSEGDETLLHLISDQLLFKEIVEFDPTLLKCKNSYGVYPIHEAIDRFSDTFVQWIFEQDMTQLYLEVESGKLPIHMACQYASYNDKWEKASLIEWMISQDETLLKAKDGYGNTPLSYITQRAFFSLAKKWIEKIPELVWERDKEGSLCIHNMSYDNDATEFLLWLFEKFPKLQEEKSPQGHLPIHLASRYGNLDLVDFLLDQAKMGC